MFCFELDILFILFVYTLEYLSNFEYFPQNFLYWDEAVSVYVSRTMIFDMVSAYN